MGLYHRWELLGNYPVFNMVLVICHYIERIWRILVTPQFFGITFQITKKYYPGEPVNINILMGRAVWETQFILKEILCYERVKIKYSKLKWLI